MGFDGLELGYTINLEQLDAWERAIGAHALTVNSVHAFCPMEEPFLGSGPEGWSLAVRDEAARHGACMRLLATLECAQRFGARAIVLHGGRVMMREAGLLFGSKPYRSKLSVAFRRNPSRIDEALVAYEQALRAEAVGTYMEAMCRSLEEVLPQFARAGVRLCFENLPGFEAFPDPAETAFLADRYGHEVIGAWFDIGHAERKQRVGDWPIDATLNTTGAMTAGVHIHDVRGLEEDHCAPGEGSVDFIALQPLLRQPQLIRVFEPAPYVEQGALQKGLQHIRWLVGEK